MRFGSPLDLNLEASWSTSWRQDRTSETQDGPSETQMANLHHEAPTKCFKIGAILASKGPKMFQNAFLLKGPQNASQCLKCFKMFQKCFKMLRKRIKMFVNSSKCFKMLQNAAKC